MPLNKNERKLLTIVGLGTFVFANVLGFTTLFAEQAKVGREQAKLKSRITMLKGWSNQSEEALKVEEFIGGNLKTYTDEGQRDTHLGDLVQGQLTDGTGVEVTKFQLLPAKSGEHFDKSRYQVTVEGEWTGVMEFIYRLQSPKDFRFVPRVQMVPRKNENNDAEQLVQVTVELEQWWARPDGSVFTGEETPAEVEQPAASGVESTTTPPSDTPVPENKPADAVPPPTGPPPGAPVPAPADAPTTTPPNP